MSKLIVPFLLCFSVSAFATPSIKKLPKQDNEKTVYEIRGVTEKEPGSTTSILPPVKGLRLVYEGMGEINSHGHKVKVYKEFFIAQSPAFVIRVNDGEFLEERPALYKLENSDCEKMQGTIQPLNPETQKPLGKSYAWSKDNPAPFETNSDTQAYAAVGAAICGEK